MSEAYGYGFVTRRARAREVQAQESVVKMPFMGRPCVEDIGYGLESLCSPSEVGDWRWGITLWSNGAGKFALDGKGKVV